MKSNELNKLMKSSPRKTNVKEGLGGGSGYDLVFNSKSKTPSDNDFGKLFDLAGVNGIMFFSKQDEGFIPWDMGDFKIDGDKMVFIGGYGPGGYGDAKVSFPLKDVDRVVEIEINPESDDQFTQAEELLANYNISLVRS